MNILILTGRLRMGHYSTSAAIKEEITDTMPYAEVQIVDIFDYIVPSIHCRVTRLFMRPRTMSKHTDD